MNKLEGMVWRYNAAAQGTEIIDIGLASAWIGMMTTMVVIPVFVLVNLFEPASPLLHYHS